MSLLEGIKINGGGTSPAPATGLLSGIKVNTSSSPAPVATSAPKTDPAYFYAKDTSGATFGPAETKDVSGKPFQGYRKPGDTATTTDTTRVASTFDPRKAQPLTHEQYYNDRAQGLRDTVGKELGITPSQELDHAIALTVGGSNDRSNLRAIPTADNQEAGNFELNLAQQLKAGKISYFDAQVADAKHKGIPTPYTDAPTPEKPSGFFQSARDLINKVSGTVVGAEDKVGTAIKNTINPPKPLPVPSPTSQPPATEALRSKALSSLPLTDYAKQLLGGIPITIADPANAGARAQTAYDTPGKTHIAIAATDKPDSQNALQYEFFNTMFYHTKINPVAFNQAWDKALKGSEPNSMQLRIADNNLNDPSTASVFKGDKNSENIDRDPFYKASERFSQAGIRLGVDGISQLPTSLQRFYQKVLTDYKEPESPKASTLVSDLKVNYSEPVIQGTPSKKTDEGQQLYTYPGHEGDYGDSSATESQLKAIDSPGFPLGIPAVVTPKTAGMNSTPATAKDADTYTSLIKRAFLNPTTANIPFNKDPNNFPYGGAALRLVSNAGTWIANAPVAGAAVLVSNLQALRQISKTGSTENLKPLQLPFDASYFGLPKGTTVSNTADRMIEDFSHRMDENPAHPVQNGLIAIVNGPINDLFMGESFANLFAGGAGAVLSSTGYNRASLDALNRLEINPDELKSLSADKASDLVRTQMLKQANDIVADPKSYVDGELSPKAERQLNALSTDVNTIKSEYNTKQGIDLNPLGKSLRNASDLLTKSVGDIGTTYPFKTAPEEGQQAIPGYRPENPSPVSAGLSTERVEPVGFGPKPETSTLTQPPVYKGSEDLSTNILEKLKGRSTVSKQFISDLTNGAELKQGERDAVRTALESYPDNKPVPVQEFADKVQVELLPLKATENPNGSRYENITLQPNERGNVANYKERVYQSPIKTSAGGVHFGDYSYDKPSAAKYFGHTRVEDMSNDLAETNPREAYNKALEGKLNKGTTRRIIEVQSDLYQKGNLDLELPDKPAEGAKPIYDSTLKSYSLKLAKGSNHIGTKGELNKIISSQKSRTAEIKKLQQYNDPTAHFRMVREEIKQAAIDGKTKLQFPTGETAMKIEGLGQADRFYLVGPSGKAAGQLTIAQIEPGRVFVGSDMGAEKWIIVDSLGEGKFRAIPEWYADQFKSRQNVENLEGKDLISYMEKHGKADLESYLETLDISGKIDTSNPIYKFYEKDLGKYLNKFGAKRITDAQGVSWYELPISKDMATKPVMAFKYKTLGSGPKAPSADVEAVIKAAAKKAGITSRLDVVFDGSLLRHGKLGEAISYRDVLNGGMRHVISLYEQDGKTSVRVGLHELKHILDATMDPKDLTALREETLSKMTDSDKRYYSDKGYKGHEIPDEYMADEWGKEQADKAGYKSKIQTVLDKINAFIKKIIDTAKAIYKDYKAIPNRQGGFVKNPLEDEAPQKYSDIEKANKEFTKVEKKGAEAENPKTPFDKAVVDLSTEKANLEQTIKANPARQLSKYANSNGELPEVLGGSTGDFENRGDDIVTELGFPDSETARAEYDNYRLQQRRLDDVKQRLAEVKEKKANFLNSTKEAKSLNTFLNKGAKQSEIEIARRDRLEDLKKAEAARQLQIKAEDKKAQTFQDKIDQAKKESAKSKGVVAEIKRALYPSHALDKVSKPIIEKWFQKTIDAKQAGLEYFNEATKKGPQNFQEIVDYQAGKPTNYIREYFDEMGTDFKRRGLNFDWKDNYMPDVWKDSPKRQLEARTAYMKAKGMTDKEIADYIAGVPLEENKALRLKLRPNFTKDRFWPDYKTGMAHGLTPKYRIPADLIGYYKEAGERAIANIELLNTLKEEARLLPSDDAPDTWQPVTLRFSREGLYAPPALADLINGKFRDEGNLKLWQSVPKGISAASRFFQDLVLSGGLPGTNVNFFTASQAYKLAATTIGDISTLKFRNTLTDLKTSFAFIRSNSNYASIRWFKTKEPYLAMMARNGIDLTDRVGGRGYKTLYQGVGDALDLDHGVKGIAKTGVGIGKVFWHKAITEKTFGSLMAQIKVSIFEGAYKAAMAKGLTQMEAEKLAAETTKVTEGITPETGRSETTKDTLSSIAFAPPYREGLGNIFVNAGKGWSTEFNNPAYSRSRSLLAGLVALYALYNLANKKINGHYMWDNPPGRELALGIPLKNGDIAYFDIGPGLLTMPRNLFLGGSALAKGDVSTAEQKFGSLLSMPLQITFELMANKDYFGNPIWSKTDDGKIVIKKIAAYVGLETSHPYVSQIYKYVAGKQPLYWSLVNMAELPVKLTSLAKEQSSAFYDNLAQKAKDQAAARAKLMPTYQKIQTMKDNGQADQADEIYNNLSDADKAVYDTIKRSEKLKDTTAREIKMTEVYKNLQQLKNEGRADEADAIYFGLSPEDQHAYDLVKAKQ